MIGTNQFLQFVVKKLLLFNLVVFQVSRAPFDFVAKSPDHKTPLLGGVACEQERDLDARSEEIASIGKIFDAQPVFVTDDKVTVNNIPMICREDFENIKCSEDLMAKL